MEWGLGTQRYGVGTGNIKVWSGDGEHNGIEWDWECKRCGVGMGAKLTSPQDEQYIALAFHDIINVTLYH